MLCFCTLGAWSQNRTSDAKEINVYGRDGKTVIAKVIIDSPSEGKLFLIKSIQKRDTANNYTTVFYLGNKEKTPILDAKILLQFSKPVISVAPSFTTAFNNINGLSDDHITYIFKAGRLERDAGSAIVISFTIISKDKIVAEISGLAGIIP